MKSIVVAVLFLAIVELSVADDNGQYRPEKYGDDGKYRGVTDGQYYDRYKNLYGTDNQYYRYNPHYNSLYNTQYNLYQRLANPYNVFRNSIIQDSLIAPQVSDTSRPPAASSTTRPVVYATPTTVLPIYRDHYSNERYAKIIAQDTDATANNYHYKYLTENGISAEENGVVDSVNGGGTRVSGFYEYVGDDGVKYRVDYTADENGFHPTGAHLP